MSRSKTIVFFILFIVLVTIVLFPIIQSKNIKMKDSQTLSNGDYVIGKDLAPGIYDVKVLKGAVNYSGRDLTKSDMLKGFKYTNQEHIIIKGDGKILLTKAKFKPLPRNDSGDYVIKHSGVYRVGEQLKSDEYLISYKVKNNQQLEDKPYVQILNKRDRDLINEFEITKQEIVEVNESNLISVNKTLFEENDNITIFLSPTN